MKIVFATGNAHKLVEIREILDEAGFDAELYTMKEAGADIDIVEDGTTFEENAMIKARAVAAFLHGGAQPGGFGNAGRDVREKAAGIDIGENSGFEAASFGTFADAIVLADDSGLEVDALNKEPGIYSSRYMGTDTPYPEKNREILRRLEGVPVEERTARFVCAVAAVFPDGTEKTVRETIEGKIGYEPRGENGFGYDPIFYLPDLSHSTAELSPEEKNTISHRGKALRAMVKLL